MDDLVGRTRAALRDGDALIVMSDHGFCSFKRGINWNAWLRDEGYLVLRPDAEPGAWYAGVDWSKTRAYALGLAGIYLNLAGREAAGVVAPADAAALKAEISAKISATRDPEHAENEPVRRVFDAAEIHRGPYVDEAPDLLIGYNDGYRISWTGATGHTDGPVFEDNTKAWSGDHCVDPALVPGVFFSNLAPEVESAHIKDLAPTALDLFGVEAPPNMRGQAIFRKGTT
jgi:predicted AlkP superfamily phosphohydrolase/phosphomutase